MMYAKYTVVLKDLLDNPETSELIQKAMSTYPLYKKKTQGEFIETYIPTREELNKAILNYYKYREIGFETVGRFADELQIALEEIMPYYNQLYFTTDQDFNILENANYTREIQRIKDATHENQARGSENENMTGSETGTTTGSETGTTNSTENSEGTSSSTANSEGTDSNTTTSNTSTTAQDTNTTTANIQNNNKNVRSQTPQGQLSITAQNIDSVDYADEVKWNKDINTESGTSTGSSSTSGTNTTQLQGNSTSETTTSGETTAETTTSGRTTSNSTGESELNKESETTRNNTLNSNGSDNENENTVEKLRGNYGMVTYQSLIEKYRELIINVTQKIIQDRRIAELFMLVY